MEADRGLGISCRVTRRGGFLEGRQTSTNMNDVPNIPYIYIYLLGVPGIESMVYGTPNMNYVPNSDNYQDELCS